MIFLRQRQRIGHAVRRLRAEVGGVQDVLQLGVPRAALHVWTDGEDRAQRRAECFLRHRAQQELPDPAAPLRAQHNQVNRLGDSPIGQHLGDFPFLNCFRVPDAPECFARDHLLELLLGAAPDPVRVRVGRFHEGHFRQHMHHVQRAPVAMRHAQRVLYRRLRAVGKIRGHQDVLQCNAGWSSHRCHSKPPRLAEAAGADSPRGARSSGLKLFTPDMRNAALLDVPGHGTKSRGAYTSSSSSSICCVATWLNSATGMCCVTNSVWHAVQRTPVSKICQYLAAATAGVQIVHKSSLKHIRDHACPGAHPGI